MTSVRNRWEKRARVQQASLNLNHDQQLEDRTARNALDVLGLPSSRATQPRDAYLMGTERVPVLTDTQHAVTQSRANSRKSAAAQVGETILLTKEELRRRIGWRIRRIRSSVREVGCCRAQVRQIASPKPLLYRRTSVTYDGLSG